MRSSLLCCKVQLSHQKREGLLTCITDRIYTSKHPLYSTVDVDIEGACPLSRLLEQSFNLCFVRHVDLGNQKTLPSAIHDEIQQAGEGVPVERCWIPAAETPT